MVMMHNPKLQAAMEYLMSYGWAILIIVIVMVGIVTLGLFNGLGSTPTSCTTVAGYSCSQIIYSHTTGTVTFLFSQSSGVTWAAANVYFIPNTNGSNSGGIPLTIINSPTSGNTIGYTQSNPAGSGLASGQITPITLTVSGPNVAIGSAVEGKLWIAYESSKSSQVYYEEVATMLLKAS
jgi:hypothetical protein